MRKPKLGLPSPALVVSFVALLVALGGTSYAAFNPPKNSVGTKQLKNGAVTTKKIRNHSVTGSKLNFAGVIVPRATHANSADSAQNAVNANTAVNAANASNLTGAGWGLVDAGGTAPLLTDGHNATVTAVPAKPGAWCISVPGTSALTTPIALALDNNNDETIFSSSAGQSTGVEWDAAQKIVTCPSLNQYAVITYSIAENTTGNGLKTTANPASFTFFVP